ncbi:MAG TPA: DEAD/DEAH box helicase [Candidatus Omnitrophota bacterium]|nr:DEAD/DEAH box helicase [Candidatus Omnitrophota bacterium]HPN55344.1 DEAD/DEAH box helicase [Candidatus Omnitrophota bacterium]
MTIEEILSQYKFPEELKAILLRSGISTLYPPQAEAIEAGALEGRNILLSVPTAAGKTLVAELCMLRALLSAPGRCLYIVPLKALASEKYEDLKKKYSSVGIKVGLATGDTDTAHDILNGYHILVATAEKVDALLRARTQWLINRLHVVVLDEIHFLNDRERGPTLEILAARIKQLNPKVQFLALSATVSNASDIASWLDARLVESRWRPIPLREGIYLNAEIRFNNGPNRLIQGTGPDLNKLADDTLRGKGQMLVFTSSRRSSEAASRLLCGTAGTFLPDDQRRVLAQLARTLRGSENSATRICRRLGDAVEHGVAFHHAGLKPEQRKLIEENFKNGLLKIVCSTPTLAAGVNLPARRAVIRDVKRFEGGLGASFIPVSEYKQCAGRAGRPQYDDCGEAVLIAKTPGEAKALAERYINADPEPVTSRLGSDSALRTHILASIAGDYVHDINDTFNFISHTFLAHQKRTLNLIEMIGNVFDFLQEEDFIEKQGFRFFATPFGQYTNRLYIDPASSIIIRDGLHKIAKGKSFSYLGLLHLTCCCPDSPLLKNWKSQWEEIEAFAYNCQDEIILQEEDFPMLTDLGLNMSIMKTTMMLCRWIDEEKEEKICDDFNIGPGDIYRHIEAVQWLLYAAITFAELFQYKKLTLLLSSLRSRVKYGIREELISLAHLKGIGRIRARHLYENGYKHATDLKSASAKDLAGIDKISLSLAQDIIQQVRRP